MDEMYRSHGICFRYPDDWEVSEHQEGPEVSISVQSPATSFWLLTLLFDCPDPDRIAEAALDAFRDEYDDLDVYPATEQICLSETLAWDIDFRCRELYNRAQLCAFRTGRFSAMVLTQASDDESEATGEILTAISDSLNIVEP